jgi:hypothetical protein
MLGSMYEGTLELVILVKRRKPTFPVILESMPPRDGGTHTP